MSAQCQIDFIHETTLPDANGKAVKTIERRRLYRCSDGYPNGQYGVISDIKQFLRWNDPRGKDLDDQVASFTFWCNLHVSSIDDTTHPSQNQSYILDIGSYNMEKFHRAIDYYYEIACDDDYVTINAYHVPNSRAISKSAMDHLRCETIRYEDIAV